MKLKPIKKYLIIFVACFFLFPLASNAQCSYERQAELSKIASNVKFSYTYDVQEDRPDFTINITNITNDIYIKEQETGNIINKEFNVPNTDIGGKSVTYNIYSNDVNCKGELLITKYVTLPEYNNFSNIEDCQDYPDFKYCKKWMNTSEITQEQFDQEFEKYTDTKFNNDNETKIKKNFWQMYFDDNKKWIMSIVICIITISLLTYVVGRMKK
ncbi:MAG: hypothetical protein HFH45_04615 [Bacilli bacterium]|nr:hypothetical protein [Bacilli bacterium]